MQKKASLIFSLLLILMAVVIWKLIYNMQFLKYDDNFGNQIEASLLSIVSIVSIIIAWFRWRAIVRGNLLVTILFLITSNPISIMIACINYASIFGTPLKM